MNDARAVLLAAVLLTGAGAPALAQHDGHAGGAGAQAALSDPAVWASDLETLYQRIRDTHPEYDHATPADDWRSEYDSLLADLDNLSFPEFALRAGAFTALARDGHTNLVSVYVPVGPFASRLPVRVYAFEEGLFVTRVTEEARAALGAQLIAVNGAPADALFRATAASLGGDNPQWPLLWGAAALSYPAALAGAGAPIEEASDPVTLTLSGADGEAFELVLTPRTDLGEAEWLDGDDLRDGAARASPSLPTERNFDFVHWPESDTVYAVYTAVEDEEDESVAEFAARLFAFIEENEAERLIFDIRDNGGGDNHLNQPLIHAMIASRTNRPGGLFILTGRQTFSAAMNLATRVERETQALFVGEPTGGAPNHYGDAEFGHLPGTGLPLLVSTLYWQDSDPSDQRPWIRPDIGARETYADWRAGRDAALEAALAYEPDGAPPMAPITRWRRASQDEPWPTMID